MKIGKKIYYDTSTGNILVITSETRSKFAKQTSIEEDIASYTALSERIRETFDVIELEYGQYAQDFAKCDGYRVSPETKEIEFSYPDPNEPEVEQPYQAPLSVEVEALQHDNKLLKAQNKANADRADFHEDLIAEMAMMVYS